MAAKPLTKQGLLAALAVAGALAAAPAAAQGGVTGNFGQFQVAPGILAPAPGADSGARISSQPYFDANEVRGNRVSLACAIVNEKEITITNITDSTIAQGTLIYYLYVRIPDGEQITRRGNSPLMPPGAVVRDGIEPALYCTSWIVVPLTMAPAF